MTDEFVVFWDLVSSIIIRILLKSQPALRLMWETATVRSSVCGAIQLNDMHS